jgi:hypothetical protein
MEHKYTGHYMVDHHILLWKKQCTATFKGNPMSLHLGDIKSDLAIQIAARIVIFRKDEILLTLEPRNICWCPSPM